MNRCRCPLVPVQRFQKSFLLQLVEDREVDETPRIGGLGSREFFHGLLASNAKLRNKIVPTPAERATEPPTDPDLGRDLQQFHA